MNKTVSEIFKILIQAGEAIVDIYENDNFQMELKSDNSPVTLADKTSSKIINEGIQQLYPEIPVLDEENTIPNFETRKNWNSYFLLDPLDGTKEFIKRNGEFCINLALMQDSKPVEGWIYQPLKKRGWHCKRGAGIFEFDEEGNFKEIEKQENSNSSIRIVTSRSFYKALEAEIIQELKKTYPVEIIHRGSSLKQVDIVLGNADMYLKAGPCSEWDTAPGQLFVEEFGGAVLRHKDFKTMIYNKSSLINPHFVMLNSRLNNAEFIQYFKSIILKLS